MTEGIVVFIIFVAAVIQIAMIVTFFRMNEKLGKIQFYLSRMAKQAGALEGANLPTASQSPKQGSGSKQPWTCPKCKHRNEHWEDNCSKCGEPR
jgi:hypothetical protein